MVTARVSVALVQVFASSSMPWAPALVPYALVHRVIILESNLLITVKTKIMAKVLATKLAIILVMAVVVLVTTKVSSLLLRVIRRPMSCQCRHETSTYFLSVLPSRFGLVPPLLLPLRVGGRDYR